MNRLEKELDIAVGEICTELTRLNASREKTSTRLESSREKYDALKRVAGDSINLKVYEEKIKGYKF